ncbi:ABC transporter ATP-binding protein, partial [Kitasatospora sp. NPDC001574]
MIRDLAAVLGPAHRRTLHRFLAILAVYGIAQGAAVSFLVPVLSRLLDGDTAGAGRWCLWAAGAVAVTLVAHYAQAMAGFRVALAVLTTLHHRLGDHAVTLPLGWFDNTTVGRLSRLGTTAVQTVSGACAHLLQPLVTGVLAPATVAVVTLLHDWRLGLAVLVCAPLVWLSARLSVRLLGRADEENDAAGVEAANRVLEFARDQAVLRAHGRAAEGYAPLEDALAAQRRASLRQVLLAVPGTLLGGFAVQLCFSVLIGVGAALALDGSTDPVELVALLALVARFTGPLAEVGEFAGVLRAARNDLRRIRAVLEERQLPEPDRSAAPRTPGALRLTGVRFGYDGAAPVLDGLDLSVPPRTMTALVGSSGSGKTTLTRLVARFFDVDAGTVEVGGTDVREQRTEDLMAQLSLVFQDVYLFDDTLVGNIRMRTPTPSAPKPRPESRPATIAPLAPIRRTSR